MQRKGLRSEFLENRGGIHVVKATAIVISGPKLGLGFPDWAERKENKQEKPSEGGLGSTSCRLVLVLTGGSWGGLCALVHCALAPSHVQ